MPVGVVVAMIAGVVAVGGLIVYFDKERRVRRLLKNATRTDIASFPDGGQAKIVGQVEIAGHQLAGPLTGRPCVYYEAVVEEYRSSGNSSRWVTVIREANGVPFFVRDGSGRALIDPSMANVSLVRDAQTKSGTFDGATPAEEAFLARHNRESKGWFFNKTLRYREGVFEPGEHIAAFGTGVREPDPDGVGNADGYRGLPPTRLRMRHSEASPLYLSDNTSTL